MTLPVSFLFERLSHTKAGDGSQYRLIRQLTFPCDSVKTFAVALELIEDRAPGDFEVWGRDDTGHGIDATALFQRYAQGKPLLTHVTARLFSHQQPGFAATRPTSIDSDELCLSTTFLLEDDGELDTLAESIFIRAQGCWNPLESRRSMATGDVIELEMPDGTTHALYCAASGWQSLKCSASAMAPGRG